MTGKLCFKVIMAKRRDTWGTLEYFKRYTWKSINKRTINGNQSHMLYKKGNESYLKKQIRLEFSKSEFDRFCDENRLLILSLYNNNLTPSIDRIDSTKHYSLDNIRIVELSQNVSRKVIK